MRPFCQRASNICTYTERQRECTYVERVDVVALGQEVQGVGDEDDCLALVTQGADDGIGEESLSYVSVDCRQRVVEDDDVGVVVQSTSNVDL